MLEFWIVFFVAVLSGMGVGGGGLLILYLTMAKNAPQLYAQGVNLWFFLLCAASALLLHCRRHRPDARIWAILSGAGLLGSLMGTALTGVLPLGWLRRIFGGMLVLSGLLVLRDVSRGMRRGDDAEEEAGEAVGARDEPKPTRRRPKQ